MSELIHESLRGINFPLTLMLGLVMLYWLGAAIGALDIDLFGGVPDIDLDLPEGGNGFFGKLLGFTNFTDAPLFIVLSLFSVFIWMGSMLSNYYFNSGDNLLLGVGLLIPNAIVSLLCTQAIVMPVYRLIRRIDDGNDDMTTIVGGLCEVVTSKVDAKSGQAEVKRKGAPIVFNARSTGESEILKGEKAVVVRKETDGTFIIKRMEE
jgi:hypothetical protein